MLEVARQKGQLSRLIELHKYFIRFTHIFLVHTNPLQQLKLQLLISRYPQQQHLVPAILPDQLLLNILNRHLRIPQLLTGLQLYLIDIDFQNLEKVLGIVFDDGILLLVSRYHGNADYFLNDFLGYILLLLILVIPPHIAQISLVIVHGTNIPFK